MTGESSQVRLTPSGFKNLGELLKLYGARAGSIESSEGFAVFDSVALSVGLRYPGRASLKGAQ